MRATLAAVITIGALMLSACGTADGSSAVPDAAPGAHPSWVTVRGTIHHGIEAGCLVLETEDGRYVLLGGNRSMLRPDAMVEVWGWPQPMLYAICKQGIPFTVLGAQATA